MFRKDDKWEVKTTVTPVRATETRTFGSSSSIMIERHDGELHRALIRYRGQDMWVYRGKELEDLQDAITALRERIK